MDIEEHQEEKPVAQGAFQEAGDIARERGAQRREAVAQGIREFTHRVTDGLTRGADYVLGSPDAALALGRRGVEAGTQAAERGAEAACEFAGRTRERFNGMRDNLAERGRTAYEGLTGWFGRRKEAAANRVNDVATRATRWGVENVVTPARKTVEAAYAIPQMVRVAGVSAVEQVGTRVAETRASLSEMRTRRRGKRADERINAEAEELDRAREMLEARARQLAEARDAAVERAEELRAQAEQTRARLSSVNRAGQVGASL